MREPGKRAPDMREPREPRGPRRPDASDSTLPPQSTRFTSTKVQTLTQKAVAGVSEAESRQRHAAADLIIQLVEAQRARVAEAEVRVAEAEAGRAAAGAAASEWRLRALAAEGIVVLVYYSHTSCRRYSSVSIRLAYEV